MNQLTGFYMIQTQFDLILPLKFYGRLKYIVSKTHVARLFCEFLSANKNMKQSSE